VTVETVRSVRSAVGSAGGSAVGSAVGWAGRRLRLAGAVALTAVAVAGCSATSGAAAVVEGEAISVAEVHRATEELGPYLQDASPSAVLLLLMAEPTFERVARENGLGVSEQEARDVLDQIAAGGAAEGVAAPEFGEGSLTVARFTLLQQRLQGLPDAAAVLEEVTTDLAELDVEVNPRFGEVDFAAGTGITPVEHAWLVAPDTALDTSPDTAP
jgi:hypothetical protein